MKKAALERVDADFLEAQKCTDTAIDFNDKDTAAVNRKIQEAFSACKCAQLKLRNMLSTVNLKEETIFIQRPCTVFFSSPI